MCPSWLFIFGVRELFTKNIFAPFHPIIVPFIIGSGGAMVFKCLELNLQQNERGIYALTKRNMLSPWKL